MAGNEVNGVVDLGDTAMLLDLNDPVLEQALSAPCPNDRLPIRVADGPVGSHPLLQPVLPNIEVVAGLEPVTLGPAAESGFG